MNSSFAITSLPCNERTMPKPSTGRRTKDSNNNAVASKSRGGSNDGAASPAQHPPELNIRVPRLRDINPPYKKSETIKRPIDIVQLTVKDVEFLNCYAILTNVCYSNFRSLGKVYFGEIVSEDGKKVRVALLRCDESAASVGGSLIVVTNAVACLAPKAVICAGCCGRLDPSRAKLGDVVISRTLSTYAHKKVTNGREENLGVRVDVTRHMNSLIHSAADGWSPPLKHPGAYNVEVLRNGGILSGPELVNDSERRRKLFEKHPTAVGIDTEGEGVYAAAHNLEIEWLVIKGISNYADGTRSETKEWENFASAMAASVVQNILKQPEVLTGFTHYKKPIY